MGFSACSAVGARSAGARSDGVDAVGARSDGVGGANACVAHSKYAATMRMIPLRRKAAQPGGSPCCRSVSTRSMQTQFCKIRRTSPLYVKMQFFLPIAASTSRQRQRCVRLSIALVSYRTLGLCLSPGSSRGVCGATRASGGRDQGRGKSVGERSTTDSAGSDMEAHTRPPRTYGKCARLAASKNTSAPTSTPSRHPSPRNSPTSSRRS